MTHPKGTIGYAAVASRYIKVTDDLPFDLLHKDFLPFLPIDKGLVLDLGAGPGRDAYEMSLRGHMVLAVEPLLEFRVAGEQRCGKESSVQWIDDALPLLGKLTGCENEFDFILSSGVWHHLTPGEQELGMRRAAQLLKPAGVFALSLRNGPAGVGTHVFPTHCRRLLSVAEEEDLTALLCLESQPSLLEGKEQVKWSSLVLQKAPHPRTVSAVNQNQNSL